MDPKLQDIFHCIISITLAIKFSSLTSEKMVQSASIGND